MNKIFISQLRIIITKKLMLIYLAEIGILDGTYWTLEKLDEKIYSVYVC